MDAALARALAAAPPDTSAIVRDVYAPDTPQAARLDDILSERARA
jgi:hypothetical protein